MCLACCLEYLGIPKEWATINSGSGVMTKKTASRIDISRLNARDSFSFDLRPDGAEVEEMARDLGLIGLRKVRLDGALRPIGKRD